MVGKRLLVVGTHICGWNTYLWVEHLSGVGTHMWGTHTETQVALPSVGLNTTSVLLVVGIDMFMPVLSLGHHGLHVAKKTTT